MVQNPLPFESEQHVGRGPGGVHQNLCSVAGVVDLPLGHDAGLAAQVLGLAGHGDPGLAEDRLAPPVLALEGDPVVAAAGGPELHLTLAVLAGGDGGGGRHGLGGALFSAPQAPELHGAGSGDRLVAGVHRGHRDPDVFLGLVCLLVGAHHGVVGPLGHEEHRGAVGHGAAAALDLGHHRVAPVALPVAGVEGELEAALVVRHAGAGGDVLPGAAPRFLVGLLLLEEPGVVLVRRRVEGEGPSVHAPAHGRALCRAAEEVAGLQDRLHPLAVQVVGAAGLDAGEHVGFLVLGHLEGGLEILLVEPGGDAVGAQGRRTSHDHLAAQGAEGVHLHLLLEENGAAAVQDLDLGL